MLTRNYGMSIKEVVKTSEIEGAQFQIYKFLSFLAISSSCRLVCERFCRASLRLPEARGYEIQSWPVSSRYSLSSFPLCLSLFEAPLFLLALNDSGIGMVSFIGPQKALAPKKSGSFSEKMSFDVGVRERTIARCCSARCRSREDFAPEM